MKILKAIHKDHLLICDFCERKVSMLISMENKKLDTNNDICWACAMDVNELLKGEKVHPDLLKSYSK